MKKKFIVRLSILLWISIMVFAACNNKSGKKNVGAHEHDANHALHKHIPGTETPIDSGLSHLLKPANERVVSNITTIKPERGTKIFSMQVQGSITYDTRDQTSIASRVSGRIERLLIKYNYQPIRKGELIMEIYSPDLAGRSKRVIVYLSN